jgi:hypothetical protein
MPPQPPPQVLLAQAKIMTEKIKAAREQIKLQNEAKDDKTEMRDVALQLLQELFAEQHPADQTLPQGGM